MKILAWAATAAMLSAPNASAAVHKVTFDALPYEYFGSNVWVEDGIVATASGALGSFIRPGTAHLDSDGHPYTEQYTFTLLGGGRFNPMSFDLFALGKPTYYANPNCPGEGPELCVITTYSDVLLTGFRNGAAVVTLAFYSGDFSTISLGSTFFNVDAFRVSAAQPSVGYCESSPCSHFNIDNVALAGPVPEPATWAMMVLGFIGLVLLRRRPRQSQCRRGAA